MTGVYKIKKKTLCKYYNLANKVISHGGIV